MIILDQAAEGKIRAKAARVAFGSASRVEEHADYDMGARLWVSIRDNATSACWETGDFDVLAYREGDGWVAVAIRAARLCPGDVATLIPARTAVTVLPPSKEEETAVGVWSHEEMSAAIAACGSSDREVAWREDFSPRRGEHGWGVEAFRSVWSEARGTKGIKGRPPRNILKS